MSTGYTTSVSIREMINKRPMRKRNVKKKKKKKKNRTKR